MIAGAFVTSRAVTPTRLDGLGGYGAPVGLSR
jgi:hypothetical protein